ncbi:arsenate reductase/protein-tyrosine-phosphatase family protein [Leifsonia aquatica]|uniref:arsenate reductase/protein-tyrosine-phosphatase family protein n=1 Tax=Leifsonia aquatica TaxID=144185 RepID=UPI00381A25C2
MPDADSATILVVCTGNICRSPYLEFALREALAEVGADDVAVNSAGTRAVVGSPIADEMGELLAADGIDARSFRARQLTRDLIEAADLVLTADRGHRKDVLQLDPRALNRTFTIRQFARLVPIAAGLPDPRHRADGSARDRLDRLIERCSAARAHTPPVGGDDDVADPWGLTQDDYERAAGQLGPAARVVADALRARAARPQP